MTRDEFDSLCGTLPSTTHVVQWGGASVWKVGGKIFAICGPWGDGAHQKISFKCSRFSYEILTQQTGIVPAPYLARAEWVQVQAPDALTDGELRAYIEQAHGIIAAKLSKSLRLSLGLTNAGERTAP